MRGESQYRPSDVLGLRAKKTVGKAGPEDTTISDIVWNKRLYNGLLQREMKQWMIEINPENMVQAFAQKYQQRFFEIVQLGRITRFAREFAFDAGAIRAWQIGKKVGKNGKVSRKLQKELDGLGLEVESARYLSKFKNMDDIQGDAIGERLISRAGFK